MPILQPNDASEYAEDLQWLEAHPDRVKAILRFPTQGKPARWVWCWRCGQDWQGAFGLRSAVDAARALLAEEEGQNDQT